MAVLLCATMVWRSPHAAAQSGDHHRVLQRWGLSEAGLPPDTAIRFKEPSLWDRHREQVVAAIAVVLIQSLVIIALLLKVRRRRRTETSLRDSEERMSLAVESTKLGFWQLDVATYRIWATNTCRAILGLDSQADLSRQSFIGVYHPEDRARATRVCEEAIAQGTSYEHEFRVVDPDGRVRWVRDRARNFCDAAGKSLRMTGVVVDITERKQAEAALRESEERYRDVVETQTELICRYLPDTTLTFVNDAYCRYFGRARDALVGAKFIDLIPENDRAAAVQHVESLAAATSRSETYEHQVIRPDGTTGWQQWTDHPIHDEDGCVVELQGVGRDVTALKRAEAEATERREQVTHLTRVAILGEISSTLAHELNQPLTAILSNAQAAQRILAREPVDLAELREILSDIAADDTHAGEVIRRLRSLVRRGEAQRQPLDINEVVTETLKLAHSEATARHVTVATSMASGLPRISGDRVQLQQVVLNLIVNACEAMNDAPPNERSLSLSTAADGGHSVVIAVADRGHGLSPEAAERLFEPFYTTKAAGLGLGLSISRSIIAAHGGHLWVVNNPEGGSTFCAVLPGIGEQTG